MPKPEPTHMSAVSEPWCPPTDRQIELARQLNDERNWGFFDSDFPNPPTDFIQLTPTEHVVLVVYLSKTASCLNSTMRTFKEYAYCIPRIHKNSRVSLSLDPYYVDLLMPYSERKPGVRWIAFDPIANYSPIKGCSVFDLWDVCNPNSLAGPEGLAALLFTDLLDSIGKNIPHINLAGYRMPIDNYLRVPQVELLADGSSVIDCGWATDHQRFHASPTFRYL